MAGEKIIGSDQTAELQNAGKAFMAPPADCRFGGIQPSTVKIREMTADERSATKFETGLPAADRLQRILATYFVRKSIFEEAVTENPDMAAHFERLLQIADQSIVAWAHYFDSEHGVPMPAECFGSKCNLIITIPYDGTEPALSMEPKYQSNLVMADMPA